MYGILGNVYVECEANEFTVEFRCVRAAVYLRSKAGRLTMADSGRHLYYKGPTNEKRIPLPDREVHGLIGMLTQMGWWTTLAPDSRKPWIQIGPVATWTNLRGCAAIRTSHWLLCLTFLVATVMTSWRWKGQ